MALTCFGSRMSAATVERLAACGLDHAEGLVGVEIRLSIDADQRAFGRPAAPQSLGRCRSWRRSRARPCQQTGVPSASPLRDDQKMAIGFQGEPVAPGRRSGRPTTMNSQRFSSSQALCEFLELQAVGDQHAHGGELQRRGSDRASPRHCWERSRRPRRAGRRRSAAHASRARCRHAARPCLRRPADNRCSRRRAPGAARDGRCGRRGCRPRPAARPGPSRSPPVRRGSPPRRARASRPCDSAPRRAARRGRRCRW